MMGKESDTQLPNSHEMEESKLSGDSGRVYGEERGIIPRCLQELFSSLSNQPNPYSVSLSMVQIYCEILMVLYFCYFSTYFLIYFC